MRDMRIVIIDDDVNRRETINRYLPDYAHGATCGYGDVAMKAISADSNGHVPDMVVMNADDSKGMGLYTFDWMKNKSGNPDIAAIPVLLLTEDEFSDRCLDFLEIDDAEFYVGEIDENRLYSAIMDTLSRMDFAEEPIEPAFADEKSYDRIAGLSVKPQGDVSNGAKQRSVVLDMDTQLQNLEAAIERGRQKSQRIRELVEAALDYKENRKEAADTFKGSPHFLNKVRVSKGLEPIEDAPVSLGTADIARISKDEPEFRKYDTENTEINKHTTAVNSEIDEEDIPEEFRLNKTVKKDFDPQAAIKSAAERLKSNPFAGMAAHGMSATFAGQKSYSNGQNVNANANQVNKSHGITKKRIVIVDDEESNLKMCELFLSDKYDIVLLDSGMKAIDYFIRNTADLVLLDTYMPNLGGVQTLGSIRWQANGKSVPVIYMIDVRYPVAVPSLQGEGIAGIMKKPFSPGSLAMTVDGFFRKQKQQVAKYEEKNLNNR